MKYILIILVTPILFLSCSTFNDAMVRVGELTGNEQLVKAGADMTPRQEYYLGRSIAAQVLTENNLVTSMEMQTYINALGHYLVLHSDRPHTFKGYKFAVVEGSSPAAMSAPGGFIFITEGMLRQVRNEEELAAVMAHEIAHVELKHAESIIQKQKRTGLALGLLAEAAKREFEDDVPAELFEWGAKGVEAVVNASFDRGQEMEADARALEILKLAGYDPQALQTILLRMQSSANFLSRHPSSDERVRAIYERVKDHQPPEVEERRRRSRRLHLYVNSFL